MDHDYDGSMGRAMALSYAEEQGKKAQRQAAALEVRVGRLERAIESLAMAANRAGANDSIMRELAARALREVRGMNTPPAAAGKERG